MFARRLPSRTGGKTIYDRIVSSSRRRLLIGRATRHSYHAGRRCIDTTSVFDIPAVVPDDVRPWCDAARATRQSSAAAAAFVNDGVLE